MEDIESQFDQYLEYENKVNRQKVVDNCVHACLYFMQPEGRSLRPIDIECMSRLHKCVNLIPVIAKADTMAGEEIADFKTRVLTDIHFYHMQIFQAPTYGNEGGEFLAEAEEITTKIPFAVVRSDKL